jgi:hypothetical protein
MDAPHDQAGPTDSTRPTNPVGETLEQFAREFNARVSALRRQPEFAAYVQSLQQRPMAVELRLQQQVGSSCTVVALRDGVMSVKSSLSSPADERDTDAPVLARVEMPLEVFEWLRNRAEDAGDEGVHPGMLSSKLWAAGEQAYQTLQSDHASFDVVIVDGPWGDEGASTTVRVALGQSARMEPAECTATLHYRDIWSFTRGDLPLMDLLFGHTQLSGDATRTIRMLMALYTPLSL